MKAQLDYWQNHHTDRPETKQAWLQLEQAMNDSIPKNIMDVIDPLLKNYLFVIEKQAFMGGFSAGMKLTAQCFSYAENTNSDTTQLSRFQ